MTKMKASIAGAVAILIFATVLVVHRQAQSNLAQVRLREENEALREQLRQTQELARQQVRPEVDSNSVPALSNKQFRELLRLRGEVGVLRERVAEADNGRAKRQQSGQWSDPNKDKVPALGDLPVMGGLFRNESNSTDPDPTLGF